jgi:membrane-associated protein
MDLIHWFLDFVLHLDRHLGELIMQYGVLAYAVLFAIIFAETGFVVTPFLPGDSLLFALGALAASPDGGLNAPLLWAVLSAAAILGNTVNYHIGRAIGAHAFSGRYRLIKVEYLRYTESYFARRGAATIVLSRFAPILRTFAPFVAGVGHMPYLKFQAYNIFGGLAWVTAFVWGGYLFGNIPVIKNNFGIVTLVILVLSVVPVILMLVRERKASPPVPPTQ